MQGLEVHQSGCPDEVAKADRDGHPLPHAGSRFVRGPNTVQQLAEEEFQQDVNSWPAPETHLV